MLRAARQAARLWCARRSAHTAAGDEVVLRFSCTACGRCCKHDGARAVLVSADEVAAIARHAAAPPLAARCRAIRFRATALRRCKQPPHAPADNGGSAGVESVGARPLIPRARAN